MLRCTPPAMALCVIGLVMPLSGQQKVQPKPPPAQPSVIEKVDNAKQELTVRNPVVVTRLVQVTKTIVDKNGQARKVLVAVPVHSTEIRTIKISLGKNKVYQLNGRRIGAESALKRLKVGSKVLIAPSPMITPDQRKLLDADSLIIVPPRSTVVPPIPARDPPKAK